MLSIVLLVVGSLIALIPIFWFINKSKTHSRSVRAKYLAWISAIISIIFLASSGMLTASQIKQRNIAHEYAGKQQAQKKAAESDDNDPRVKDSSAQIKKMNFAIAKSLKDDQQDAKDPNNPLKSDHRYSYVDKVEAIEYLGNQKINVQVSNIFSSLSDDDKKGVINYAQDCTVSGKMMSISAVSGEESEKGFDTSVKMAGKTIGHSTPSNFHEYTWNV